MDRRPAIFAVGRDVRLVGHASCGITNQVGFHAAGGECYSALIFGQTRSLAIETDGTFTDLSLVGNIVKTATLFSPGDVDSIEKTLMDGGH